MVGGVLGEEAKHESESEPESESESIEQVRVAGMTVGMPAGMAGMSGSVTTVRMDILFFICWARTRTV